MTMTTEEEGAVYDHERPEGVYLVPDGEHLTRIERVCGDGMVRSLTVANRPELRQLAEALRTTTEETKP